MVCWPILQTRIPVEVLDEILGLLDKHTLSQTALVCSRWRLISQRKLFAHIDMDPTKEHGLYHPQPSHLSHYVKELTLTGIEWNDLHPGFADFLRQLALLETLSFARPAFHWNKLSQSNILAFTHVFSLRTLATIKIYSRGVFPLPFLVECASLKQLEIIAADTTLEQPAGLEPTIPASPIYLGSLSLEGNDNVRLIQEFVSNHAMAGALSFARLHELDIQYIGFDDSDPSGDEIVGKFLDAFGTPVGRLRLQYDIFADLDNVGAIAGANLQSLTSLSCLTTVLGLHDIIIEDLDTLTIVNNWLLPILIQLPSPHLLRELNIEFQYHLHTSVMHPNITAIPTSNTTVILDVISSNIGTLFLGLEFVNFRIDLYGHGIKDFSPQTVLSPKRFPELEKRGIQAAYRWSDPDSRLMF